MAGWRLLPHYAPGLLVCEEADGGEVGSGGSSQTCIPFTCHLPQKAGLRDLGILPRSLGEGRRGAAGSGASEGSIYLQVPAPPPPAFPGAAAPVPV